MNIKIFYSAPKWMFGGDYWGRIVYPFIFYKDSKADVKDYMIRHELEHVYQIRKDGWWKYNIVYIYQWIRYGYKEVEYEKAAYSIQNTLLTDRERFIKEKGGE